MVSDPKILAPFAQLSLYIIRHNHTLHGFLKFIDELSDAGNIPNLRLIYNGIKLKKARGPYYWNSYGYYGYRYNNKNPYTQNAKTPRMSRKSVRE
jgi:hypothetical protein